MRKLTYFIAATLDGYIAGTDGRIDFFPIPEEYIATLFAEYPETLPVPFRRHHGKDDLPNRRYDTLVMGRATYDPGIEAGLTSPYPHLKQYVFSTTLDQLDPEVEIVGEDPAGFVRELKRQDGLGIWLCGGASLAGQLIDEIDELVIKRHPFVLGAGIPLFAGDLGVHRFHRTDTRSLDCGISIETYEKASSS